MERICIVVRSGLDAGRAMNACGHLAFGLGARMDSADAAVRDFYCASSTLPVSSLTDHPLIVLRAGPDDLTALLTAVKDREDLMVRVFYDVFFEGTPEDQGRALLTRTPTEVEVAAVALSGSKSTLSKLTRRLELFR
jgi:hypothetical protein